MADSSLLPPQRSKFLWEPQFMSLFIVEMIIDFFGGGFGYTFGLF